MKSTLNVVFLLIIIGAVGVTALKEFATFESAVSAEDYYGFGRGINLTYGAIYYHNDTAGTLVNFAQQNVMYPLFFTNASHLNGFTAQLGFMVASNLTANVSGHYRACYFVSGSGENNHKYATSILLNGKGVENCEVYHQMSAGGDVITQTACCIIQITKGDTIGVGTEDYSGTGAGYYYSGNLNLVRVGG